MRTDITVVSLARRNPLKVTGSYCKRVTSSQDEGWEYFSTKGEFIPLVTSVIITNTEMSWNSSPFSERSTVETKRTQSSKSLK